ncbi:MAG: sulfurtransferase [Candidimonas sp.]|jgi:thiosulfate/3-mercaptopyruvate sulfurtransferase
MTTPHIDAPSNGLAQAAWLARNLDRQDVVVLDSTTNLVPDEHGVDQAVADYDAFLRAHIPGAQFVDLQATLSDPDGDYLFTVPEIEHFEQALRKLGIDQDSVVIIYSTGNPWWATRIWWLFHHFGLDNAFVLDGGLRHWLDQDLPIASGPAQARPTGHIRVHASRDLAIDGRTLLSRLDEPALTIVNALPEDKFSGKSRVHGGRPGHIPGSINVPAAGLVDKESGLFLEPRRTEALLDAARLLDKDREVVAYCGGGISATLVIFALHRAGRERVKLYDASLSEWAHDEAFPMVDLTNGTRSD